MALLPQRSARYWLIMMTAAVALAAVSFGDSRPIFGGIYLACAAACAWLAAQRRRADAAQTPAEGEDAPDKN